MTRAALTTLATGEYYIRQPAYRIRNRSSRSSPLGLPPSPVHLPNGIHVAQPSQQGQTPFSTRQTVIKMLRGAAVLAASLAGAAATSTPTTTDPSVTVVVPACPDTTTISYAQSVPDKDSFPLTTVGLCYDDDFIHLNLTAYGEEEFYFDPNQTTNGDIWEYEVMEAFISKGTGAPQTYLEYEVNPNNVTFNSFIYNPSKVRATDAPFDRFYIADPFTDGFTVDTTVDKAAQQWGSVSKIPLGLFNVDSGEASGTSWRMNFFRTITSPEIYPNQTLGGWSSPDQASFHMTPFFGNLTFA